MTTATANTRPRKGETIRLWRALALPGSIATWLESLSAGGRAQPYIDRAARFVNHCATDATTDRVRKDWRAVSAAPKRGADAPELAVFMALPDDVTFNPHARLYGARRLDADIIKIERKRYVLQREHAQAVIKALANDGARVLLQDASATPTARALAAEFRAEHLGPLKAGLRALDNLLATIEPAAKVPTDHPFKANAEQSIFANLVADLNRHLPGPQHAALVRLAKVNCPAARITPSQVRMAWNRANERT